MSTRASASAVFPVAISDAWKVVREFDQVPARFGGVASVELEGGSATAVGVIRVVKWKTGEERRQQRGG